MARRNARHQANLTIRLIGLHEAAVNEVNDQVQVMIPGGVITLADAEAAVGVFRAWHEARAVARKVFTGDTKEAARLYEQAAQRVLAAVLLTGTQPGPTVLGKAPKASPSGCGQVVVRIGRLTIVCDDKAAWDIQFSLWEEAYRVAGTVWNTLDARNVAAAAERRGLRRVMAEWQQ
jgi:hypothetical protein